MKTIHATMAAIAAVAVVTAGAIALTGGDDAPAPPASSDDDVSRPFDPSEEGEAGAAQMEEALREQARLVEMMERQLPHTIRVTIREESPYDAYKPEAGGVGCVRATDVPSQLVVEAVSGKGPKFLADQEIPATARLTSDGACESTMSMDVPQAARYRLGVAIEGHGISLPTDPGMTYVKADDSPQRVVVLR